jgi:hypothetical protein
VSTLTIGISTAVAIALTPAVARLWGQLAPPEAMSEFDRMPPDQLKRRNNWIDMISTILCLTGVCAPLLLYMQGVSKHNPWPVGLAFGLMVILPMSFVLSATLPRGMSRLREFARFYELKYRIRIKGLLFVYVPFAILGVVSAIELAF